MYGVYYHRTNSESVYGASANEAILWGRYVVITLTDQNDFFRCFLFPRRMYSFTNFVCTYNSTQKILLETAWKRYGSRNKTIKSLSS